MGTCTIILSWVAVSIVAVFLALVVVVMLEHTLSKMQHRISRRISWNPIPVLRYAVGFVVIALLLAGTYRVLPSYTEAEPCIEEKSQVAFDRTFLPIGSFCLSSSSIFQNATKRVEHL